ncbi:hypothetical protein K493DRAFT_285773 [Basidiobolus meristosporus CBS 931.73]|uniref:Membrane insertase YidC/Oxa/ALB C-terminal domain-containing protein n=1 Tax=Basidiobolus meristosporus CBS 931.73 TaxID=1314790 RepID=A0A1Y1Y304_9FUNG|nr:hypothetical protein K493DRAFT_285773 [Basidiobolus meristosporus CBS 931.73]|eukprot:ORX92401.1 hypothetical protein K493DRAFT_285773 [Basidiobolus meristosporus CBS 931.73]
MNAFSTFGRTGAIRSILEISTKRAIYQGVRQNSTLNSASAFSGRSRWNTLAKVNRQHFQRAALPALFSAPLRHGTGLESNLSFGLPRFNSTSTNVPVVDTTTSIAGTSESGSVLTSIADSVDANAIVDAAMKVGDLKAMGLVNFTPVGFIQAALEFIHVSTGIPWWGTIVATTLLIRLALFPIVVKLQRNAAVLHNIKPEMDRLTAHLNRAKSDGDTVAIAQYSHEFRQLFEKHNANPLKMLALPLMQAPVMLSFFFALRDMAQLPVPQFQTGGTAWFTDLTAADPLYILPVVSGLGFLAILELGSEAGTNVGQTKNVKWFFRFMAVAMVPVTANFASSIFVYWVTSNAFSIGQVLTLKNPAIRKSMGIPLLMEHKTVGSAKSKKSKTTKK